MSITGIVENGMIKLPVHVPDGTPVEVIVKGGDSAPVQRSQVREWARHARGSVRLESEETVDDARMAFYAAKFGSLR